MKWVLRNHGIALFLITLKKMGIEEKQLHYRLRFLNYHNNSLEVSNK